MDPKNDGPGRYLGISGAYWEAFTLQAAVKLDLFSLIGDDAVTGADLSGRLGADQRGVETLLNALTALEMLEKTDGVFRNTAGSRSYLCKDAPGYVGHMIMHHWALADSWHRLDEAVMAGQPVRGRASARGEQEREYFLMGMFNIAMQLAPRIAEDIDLAGRRRLVDLGGGPGTWAIHFCLANPDLRATVYDLATSRPFAEQTIGRFDVADRVDFQAGDFVEGTIEGKFDAAWLSHILHGEGPQVCQTIVDKAVATLQPGGRIFVHEFILDDDLAGPAGPAVFSLNMLLGTESGRSYSEQQITVMLTRAGATGVERLPFSTPKGNGIITGTVK